MRVRVSEVIWGLILAAAAVLPVAATASWLNAAHGALPADRVAGVWLLKITIALLAMFAISLSRSSEKNAAATPAAEHAIGSPTGVVWLVIGAALALRLYRLDTELWLDEVLLLARYVPLEFRQLISTFDSQNHQPLYSLMAKAAYMVAGPADWAIRVPAVLFGVASLGALWWFGRRVTSGPEAMLAVVILAVSYHHVWFSQNARGYTTMLFLSLAGSTVFLRLCQETHRDQRLVWSYAVLMALATYTHLTAALIAVGHALALLLVTRWTSAEERAGARWPLIGLVASALITLCLYSLMLPQVVRQLHQPTMEGVAVEWTGIGWMLREAARVLSAGIPGGLASVMVALVVVGAGVWSYWRQSRLLTLVMFMPLLVTLGAVMAAGHNLWPRFFFFAAGFLVLAAIRGGFTLVRAAVRWHPDRIAIAGASVVALLSLTTVPRAWQPKQQFRAAYDFVESQRLPGDVAVAVDMVASVYRLRGWAPTWRLTTDSAELAAAARSARRTWVVYTLPARLRAAEPELYRQLSPPRYETVRVFPATVGGGEIHVLRHDTTLTHD